MQIADDQMQRLVAALKALPQDSWQFQRAERCPDRICLRWRRPCGASTHLWITTAEVLAYLEADRLEHMAAMALWEAGEWWAHQ